MDSGIPEALRPNSNVGSQEDTERYSCRSSIFRMSPWGWPGLVLWPLLVITLGVAFTIYEMPSKGEVVIDFEKDGAFRVRAARGSFVIHQSIAASYKMRGPIETLGNRGGNYIGWSGAVFGPPVGTVSGWMGRGVRIMTVSYTHLTLPTKA